MAAAKYNMVAFRKSIKYYIVPNIEYLGHNMCVGERIVTLSISICGIKYQKVFILFKMAAKSLVPNIDKVFLFDAECNCESEISQRFIFSRWRSITR
jgi:hypothetical protein